MSETGDDELESGRYNGAEMTLDVERIQFPDAIVARAVVLLAEGRSNRDVERTLAKDFPGERTPSRESIRQWDMALAETCQEEGMSRISRIINLADDAVVAGLIGATASDHPEKYIIPANAVAGTYRDKRDRVDGRSDKPPSVTVFVGVHVDK